MEFKRIDCPSCGAPLVVNDSLESIACDFCNTTLAVEYSGGDLALKHAKEVEQGLKDVGEKMETSIRESSSSTQLELKRLQTQQQLVSLENRLGRLNDEIRYLESRKINRSQKKQLANLRTEKFKINQRIKILDEELYGAASAESAKIPSGVYPEKKGSTKAGCLSGCLVYMILGVILGSIGMGIDSIIFGSEIEQGPFFTAGAIIGLVAGVTVFFYKSNPDSKFSLWIKERLGNIIKKKSKK
jgi:uncharacterized Zn finger protein (UPF0148 family)